MPNNADGSIVIKAEVDDNEAQKRLNQLKRKIDSLEKQISESKQSKMPLVEQARQLGAELDNAKAKLYEMRSASTGSFTKDEITDQAETVRALQSQWDVVQNSISKYDRSIASATAKLDAAKEEAGELAARLSGAKINTKEMSKAMEKARKSAERFGLRIREVVRSALVFTFITQSLANFREWMGKVIKTSSEATQAISRLKGALLTLAQPLVEVIIPTFTAFINALSAVISKIAQFVSKLFGKTADEARESAKALHEEMEALEGTGDAAKKAAGSLAGFDEINTINTENTKAETSSIEPDFDSFSDSDWLKNALGDVAGKVTSALMLGGIALVAFGAATGSLSLVLAGLVLLGVGIVAGTEGGGFSSWAESLGLDSVTQYVALALLLGGIVLVVIGASTGSVLTVVAGLGLLGSGIFLASEKSEEIKSWVESLGLDSVFDYVTVAIQLAGIALVAIGACKGNIAMVIAGAALLAVGIGAEIIGEETLKSWWEVLKLTTVQQWVGAALLLLGIALIVIGACLGNLVVVLAGAAFLSVGTITSATEQNLKNWVTVLGLEKVAGWVTAGLLLVGIALVVFGILSGNIMMVLAGAGMLGAGISVGVTSGTFEGWLNTIVTAFSGFKTKVLEIFSGLWDGVKSYINTLLGGVEWMANKVVAGINNVIDAMNRIQFEIPDYLGGGSFGFNIKKLSTISIPRLATGAVVPPNREFMAILGDNKTETEVVSPLSTMKQAMMEAMQESGFGGEINITLVTNLDGREVARNQVKHINAMTQQAGKSVLLF